MKPADKRFFVALTLIGFLLIGWWAWSQFSPKPLGEKLEYLGREDYGCYIICDSPPESTYYYGTNMNLDETEQYFTGAEIKQSPKNEPNYKDYKRHYISFTNTSSKKEFSIIYYESIDQIESSPRLHSTKTHFISIQNKQYKPAREAL